MIGVLPQKQCEHCKKKGLYIRMDESAGLTVQCIHCKEITEVDLQKELGLPVEDN